MLSKDPAASGRTGLTALFPVLPWHGSVAVFPIFDSPQPLLRWSLLAMDGFCCLQPESRLEAGAHRSPPHRDLLLREWALLHRTVYDSWAWMGADGCKKTRIGGGL